MQQTFLAAYSDLVGSDKPIQLRPWLYTIARNRCLSVLRVPAAERCDAGVEPPRPSTCPPWWSAARTCATCSATSPGLPDDQRAALVLAEVGGMPHEEIAAVLSVPPGQGQGARVPGAYDADRRSVGARDPVRGDPRAAREPDRELAAAPGPAPAPARLRRLPRVPRRRCAPSARELALVLPVAPTLALKSGVLAGAGVSAAGAGGGGGDRGDGIAGRQDARGGGAGRRWRGGRGAPCAIGAGLRGRGRRGRRWSEGRRTARPRRSWRPRAGAVPTTVPAAGGASEATPKAKEKGEGRRRRRRRRRRSVARRVAKPPKRGQDSQGRR